MDTENTTNETKDTQTGGTTVVNNIYQADSTENWPHKSKIAAGLFCLLLGDIGVGNFYLGNIGLGIVDILFCWTAIPGIVNLIRGIIILCSSDENFERKYRVKVEK